MAREFKTQIKITVGAGAPLDVNSSTEVTNLNVGQLKGSTWAAPAGIGSTTPNTGAFTTLTASISFGVGGTPSAWSGTLAYPVQSRNMAMVSSGTDYGFVVNNYYFDGTNYRYVNNGQAAGIYFFSGTDGGGFQFVGFPSGTAGGILPAGATLLTLGLTGVGIAGTSSTTTRLNIPAGTTGVSSLRVPHGSAPTSPVDGDMWSTTAGLYVRVNGTTIGPLGGTTGISQAMTWTVTSGTFNAVKDNGYILTGTSTVTLPGSPAVGDRVGFALVGTLTVTIARNALKIMGLSEDLTVDVANAAFDLVYSDATNGWRIV